VAEVMMTASHSNQPPSARLQHTDHRPAIHVYLWVPARSGARPEHMPLRSAYERVAQLIEHPRQPTSPEQTASGSTAVAVPVVASLTHSYHDTPKEAPAHGPTVNAAQPTSATAPSPSGGSPSAASAPPWKPDPSRS
jgi:hypothetical protein